MQATPSILIVYATDEGQTAKVTDRIVDVLADAGFDAEGVNVADAPPDLDVSGYDAALVGASIHVGKHQKRITRFVETHRDALAAIPNGFFEVCLSAALEDDESQAEAAKYVEEFIETTGWEPDRIGIFGGALRFSEYGFIKRQLMKRIASDAVGEPIDASRDYEFTDWDEVEAFATEFGRFVGGEDVAMGSADTDELAH